MLAALRERIRRLWRTARQGAVDAAELGAAPREAVIAVGAALTAELEPGERIEFDAWVQASPVKRRRRSAGDSGEADVSTLTGMAGAASTAIGQLRDTIAWVDTVLPVRVVVTDRRVLVGYRAVSSSPAVRCAPRTSARSTKRAWGALELDVGDGGPPIRLSPIQRDDLRALAAALG